LSQQYWTAYVYASENVFHQAWQEFQQSLDDYGAEWEYEYEGDGQWYIKRIRENENWDDDDEEEEYMGDIGYSRYRPLEISIERITERIERERQRLEEEQRRREEEERAKKAAAKSQIEIAIKDANSFLASDQYEEGESILAKYASAYNRYKTELDLSEFELIARKIKKKKSEWMDSTIKSINVLIQQRKWDDAKNRLDNLRTERVTSTGRSQEIQSIRAQLNREKKEWEEAERERLRLEKIANEKKAEELASEYLRNWSPEVEETDLLSDKTGFDAFLESLAASDDGAFCNENNAWMDKSGAMKEQSKSILSRAKHNKIDSMISSLVHDEVSRENILTNETLAGESNPLNSNEMQECFIQGMKEHFGNLYAVVAKNNYTVSQDIVAEFTILFEQAQKEYIEEQIKMKNTELAKAMVGRALKMQEEDDFVSMVEASYIGQHAIRMFVSEDGVQRELLKMEEMVAHIEAGSNLVIILEECYDTDQEMNHGHIKDSKIFE